MIKKSNTYSKERKVIFEEILNKFDIEIGKMFLVDGLDYNKDCEDYIRSIEDKITTYYSTASWACFHKPEMGKRVSSFIRYVAKDMGYNCEYFYQKKVIDGKRIRVRNMMIMEK